MSTTTTQATTHPSLPSTHQVYRYASRPDASQGPRQLVFHRDAATPANPSRGQVVVRIRAISLNARDLQIRSGEYPGPVLDELIPVSDGAGEVAAVGEAAGSWRVGDRVVIAVTPGWLHGDGRDGEPLSGTFGGNPHGLAAQFVTVDHTALVRLPDAISFEEAATLPGAGVTAYHALYSGAVPLKPGRVVLTQGTGGVSILAAQLALAAGARVIATSSSDDKLARLQKLGVAEGDVINYKTTPQWAARARELTGGKGADHVVDVSGAIKQSLSATRVGGEVTVIGTLGGTKGESVGSIDMILSGATLRGIVGAGSRQDLVDLVQHIQATRIHPVIDRVFSFEELPQAMDYLATGSQFGKVVVRID